MQLSDWLKRTIVRDILANGYRKKQLKLTKFVLRVLFQSSSSRTAALLQTMSSLPHKERILGKASLIIIIIIIIIIIKFSMHTVECKVIITWHSHIIIYSNLLLLLLICYYCYYYYYYYLSLSSCSSIHLCLSYLFSLHIH